MLPEERPGAVLGQGDNTTAFAGNLAAFYERVPVGHPEAGLRTYDLAAPLGRRRGTAGPLVLGPDFPQP